jgi:hypothetical protein
MRSQHDRALSTAAWGIVVTPLSFSLSFYASFLLLSIPPIG